MDFVNAEIISGLDRGEVVSTGETTVSEPQSGSDATEPETNPAVIRILGG